MIDKLTHGEKVMLYVMGILQGLKAKGIVSGGADLSHEGQQVYEQLQAQGFKPTQSEMQTAIATIKANIGIEQR